MGSMGVADKGGGKREGDQSRVVTSRRGGKGGRRGDGRLEEKSRQGGVEASGDGG